jgi:DNA-binding NarL/FixJ family response regulator
MIRVAVADDQALIRLGLRVLVEAEDDLTFVGEAADGRAAIDLVRSTRPDVMLMDVRMPDIDGIDALRTIAAEPAMAATRVIMLTTFDFDEYIFEALRAGASGFLIKDAEPAELLRAIRVVAGGDELLSPTVTRRLIQQFVGRPGSRRTPHPNLNTLTERECEIAGWVATGLANEEIAQRLNLSPATVRTHVSRAMLKLHARDRAQLVVFAIQSGLTIPDDG